MTSIVPMIQLDSNPIVAANGRAIGGHNSVGSQLEFDWIAVPVAVALATMILPDLSQNSIVINVNQKYLYHHLVI